jgi:hypothetical protein
MSNVKEFRVPIERKRPTAIEWEFQGRIGQHDVLATEYKADGQDAWLVKVGEQTYWVQSERINIVGILAPGRFEKYGDPIDPNLQERIHEALRQLGSR